MNGVIVKENENIDKAIRRFMKNCEHFGVLSELKKYRYYEKPSEMRKRERNASERRRMREAFKIK
jgi:small subunit ribosomal protein S21